MSCSSLENLQNICDTLDECKRKEMDVEMKKKKKKKKSIKVSAYITADEVYELEMIKRLNKAINRYEKYSKLKKDNEKKKLNKVEKLLLRAAGPTWYQELSGVQVNAADSLYGGIRDDLEQGTVHRSFRSLRNLGIYPIVNNKCIQRALELSRGNDLAFLWFLMELYYNSSCPAQKNRQYTVNERILMSTICHLDMIPTLRELDKILPVPKQKEKHIHYKKFSTCTCKFHSPYLQPQCNIKVPRSSPLPPPPIPGLNFGYYNLYKDPNFTLPNETNRWYNIKVKEPVLKTSTEEFINDLICQHIYDVTDGDFDRTAVLECLCDNHEKLSEYRKKQIKQLVTVTRCRCRDEKYDEKAILRNKVITQIELDAAQAKKEFSDLARGYQTQIIIKTILRNIIDHAPDIKNIKPCMNCKECIEEYDLYQHLYSRNKCSCEVIPEEKQFLNLGHEGKAKKKYFYKPTSSFPYRFDYERIFRDAVYKDPVKESVCLALDLEKYATEDEAITICMKDLWKLEVKMWNERMDDLTDDECVASTASSELKKKKKCKKKQKHDQEICSTSTRLLKKLLKNALRQMRKNPKFVLVTMPEVYKLKILEEWILERYGHVYTRLDRQAAIAHSKLQWNMLMNTKLKNVKAPSAADVSDSTTIDYDYRKRLAKKVDITLEEYHRNLNMATSNECRMFWPTMAPFLCPSGCPREVFYAYMPSCKYDILPIKPWKLFEAKESKQRYLHSCH